MTSHTLDAQQNLVSCCLVLLLQTLGVCLRSSFVHSSVAVWTLCLVRNRVHHPAELFLHMALTLRRHLLSMLQKSGHCQLSFYLRRLISSEWPSSKSHHKNESQLYL
jgi:hypothetical protein